MVPVGTMSRGGDGEEIVAAVGRAVVRSVEAVPTPTRLFMKAARIASYSDQSAERSSCFGLTLDADSSRPSLGRGGASTRLPTRRNSHCRDVTGPSEALVRLS